MRLSNGLPSIEPRHVIEVAAVLVGAKRVVRVIVGRDEHPRARERLRALGLAVETSPFALATEFQTALGDRFVSHVSPDDPRAESLVLLGALERGEVERAIAVETGGDNLALGALYEYPPCCVAAYEPIAEGRDWVAALLDARPVDAASHAWGNRIGSLFEGHGFLPDYFPCSLECEASRSLGARCRQAALDESLDAAVAAAEASLTRPVIAWRGLLVQPIDAVETSEGVTFDGATALRFDWRDDERHGPSLLDDVRAVVADARGVTLLDHRRRPVGASDGAGHILRFTR